MEDHLRSIRPSIGTPFAGAVMSQSFSALYWFERFFQEEKPHWLLELGTGNGTLTLFFGLHLPDRVVTVDKATGSINNEKRHLLFKRLGITFLEKDLLDPGTITELIKTRVGRPLLVFCDNGNKKQEFLEAAPLLAHGDAIMVHDVNVEFDPMDEQVATAIQDADLMPWKCNVDALADKSRLSCWMK